MDSTVRRGHGLRMGVLVAGAFAASPVMAQQAAPAGEVITLDTVEVTGTQGQDTRGYQPRATSTATRSDTPLLDIPQAVNVVSRDVIRDQHATSLDEALYNISGISQANTLGGTQDSVIRRGFGDNRDGSILTNGLKTALPRSFNATTDRVEVLKGPSSTLYGILDPGGMVNVVTKAPEYEFGGKAYGSLSSFGGGTAGFDVTGPIGDSGLAYRLIGEYRNIDYWRNFGETESWLVAPSLTWRGTDSEITVSYLHEEYKVPFDRGTIFDETTGKPVDVDRKTRFDEPYNITDGKSDLVSIAIDRHLGDDWTVSLDYSYSRNEYSDNQARVIRFDPATGNVVRRADATQHSTIYNHAARLDVTGDVTLGGLRNDILFGASYDYADTLRTDMIRCGNRPASEFNIYDPVYGNLPECTNISAADSDQTEQISTGSLYVQDSLHLNEQWILVAGLRYQYYDLMAGKGRPFNANTDSYGDAFIPRGGIVYKVTPDISLYANAAKTFRPQSSIASAFGNLPPEEGYAYELGGKFDLLDGLSANIALYESRKKNVAYTVDVGGNSQTMTAGLVRARGVEIDIAGQITPDLSIIASYGFTAAMVLEDPVLEGQRPVNVPRHTGSLFLAYDFGEIGHYGDRLRAGGGIRGAADRAAINDNAYFLPDYLVADAFIAYTVDLATPVTLQLNLKNIFDKTYYTSSIGTNYLGNAIGEPFNATLSATVDF